MPEPEIPKPSANVPGKGRAGDFKYIMPWTLAGLRLRERLCEGIEGCQAALERIAKAQEDIAGG